MNNFDAIIIGSGQAGTPLVFKMAAQGKKVAFIEKEHLGGTCLNVGCTPTKTYVASARRMWDVKHGEELGINKYKLAMRNSQQIKYSSMLVVVHLFPRDMKTCLTLLVLRF